MQVFTSPNLADGKLQFALARKPANRVILIYTFGAGMADTRQNAVLNSTTPPSEKLEHSADNRPLIWLDSDVDRDERGLGPTGGMLLALLAADPPVIKATGRKRMMHSSEGGEREASEVEVLLPEQELGRVCYYCGSIEVLWEDRLKRCGGEGYDSLYWCEPCSKKPTISRVASSALNSISAFIRPN